MRARCIRVLSADPHCRAARSSAGVKRRPTNQRQANSNIIVKQTKTKSTIAILTAVFLGSILAFADTAMAIFALVRALMHHSRKTEMVALITHDRPPF